RNGPVQIGVGRPEHLPEPPSGMGGQLRVRAIRTRRGINRSLKISRVLRDQKPFFAWRHLASTTLPHQGREAFSVSGALPTNAAIANTASACWRRRTSPSDGPYQTTPAGYCQASVELFLPAEHHI